jgi:hypothetical protein
LVNNSPKLNHYLPKPNFRKSLGGFAVLKTDFVRVSELIIYQYLYSLLKTALIFYVFLFSLTIAAAFICGPHSCEWGFGVYFFSGIGATLFSGMAPLFMRNMPLKRRLLYGVLFAVLYIVLWVCGFLLGDFRIICRLF